MHQSPGPHGPSSPGAAVSLLQLVAVQDLAIGANRIGVSRGAGYLDPDEVLDREYLMGCSRFGLERGSGPLLS
jgi:hypothetical protein